MIDAREVVQGVVGAVLAALLVLATLLGVAFFALLGALVGTAWLWVPAAVVLIVARCVFN